MPSAVHMNVHGSECQEESCVREIRANASPEFPITCHPHLNNMDVKGVTAHNLEMIYGATCHEYPSHT